MARSLVHRFSDLPLIVDGPFEDNGVEGEAEITYWPDGQWQIESISITISRARTLEEIQLQGTHGKRPERQHVLERGSFLDATLRDRLMTNKYRKMDIQDSVREALECDYVDAPSVIADHRARALSDLARHDAETM